MSMVWFLDPRRAEHGELFSEFPDPPGYSGSPAKNHLGDAWDKNHVEDEGDVDRGKWNEVCEPIADAVVALECLRHETHKELRPDINERGCHCSNHRETQENFNEVQKLPSEGFGHVERNHEWPE